MNQNDFYIFLSFYKNLNMIGMNIYLFIFYRFFIIICFIILLWFHYNFKILNVLSFNKIN